MKKAIFILLILGIILAISSCARPNEVMDYINSKGYLLLTKVGESNGVYLFEKDGKVYYAEGIYTTFKKDITKNIIMIEVAALAPRGAFNINIK
jgi:hypothetical protein